METEPPQAPENSDQSQAVAVSTTTDDQQQSPSQARSYECTFCKRGFSNAQALGGHMNIHRKDKAKLKQASNESTQTQQLLDIPQSPRPLYPPPIPPNPIQIPEYKSSDQEKSSKKWPWIFSTDQVSSDHETHLGGGQLRQLPLFAEIASRSENRDHAGKGLSSSHEQLAPEVDLELRLGHEPQDSSSAAATGTKKFY